MLFNILICKANFGHHILQSHREGFISAAIHTWFEKKHLIPRTGTKILLKVQYNAGVEKKKQTTNESFVLSCFNLLLILEIHHGFFTVQSVLTTLLERAFYC